MLLALVFNLQSSTVTIIHLFPLSCPFWNFNTPVSLIESTSIVPILISKILSSSVLTTHVLVHMLPFSRHPNHLLAFLRKHTRLTFRINLNRVHICFCLSSSFLTKLVNSHFPSEVTHLANQPSSVLITPISLIESTSILFILVCDRSSSVLNELYYFPFPRRPPR